MNGGFYRGARRSDAHLYYFDRGRVYVLFLDLESKLTWRGDSLPEEEYKYTLPTNLPSSLLSKINIRCMVYCRVIPSGIT